MQQRIAHIGFGSALRMAGLIGCAVWLLPSLLLAMAALTVLRRLQLLFAQLSTVTIAIPAQQLGPLTFELPPLQLDLVERLGLAPTDQTISSLAASPWVLGIMLTLGLVLLGTLLTLGLVAVAVLTYNVLAPRFGGIEVHLTGSEVGRSAR